MSAKTTNIRIAGIGGMGVLTSSRILAELLFQCGFDVKKAEVHGMSQRGGSICSDVRFGAKVHSPMIPAGEIDYLLLFQRDQYELYQAECGPQTTVLHADEIDLAALPKRKTLNVAMLGLLSRQLEIDCERWLAVIAQIVPERFLEINREAFLIGRGQGAEK
jgi:indolepyruvate ferredoxin oxidoreductase, beta subunit